MRLLAAFTVLTPSMDAFAFCLHRSIVPFQTAENAFTNKRIPPGTHKPTIMSAFQALGRMISLFVENEGDADMISAFSFSSRTRTEDPMRALHHALSSSSSASHSSPSSISSPPAIARTRGECSECFSEGVTLRRVKVFAQRAQEWLNGDCPVMRGCDAVSVCVSVILCLAHIDQRFSNRCSHTHSIPLCAAGFIPLPCCLLGMCSV